MNKPKEIWANSLLYERKKTGDSLLTYLHGRNHALPPNAEMGCRKHNIPSRTDPEPAWEFFRMQSLVTNISGQVMSNVKSYESFGEIIIVHGPDLVASNS